MINYKEIPPGKIKGKLTWLRKRSLSVFRELDTFDNLPLRWLKRRSQTAILRTPLIATFEIEKEILKLQFSGYRNLVVQSEAAKPILYRMTKRTKGWNERKIKAKSIKHKSWTETGT